MNLEADFRMQYIRTISAAVLSLLLALVFDGVFLLACPAPFAASDGCSHCPRPKTTHCPLSGGEEICPLLSTDKLAGEVVKTVGAAAVAPIAEVASPVPTAGALTLAEADDWHHASDLYIRIRVLRI